ncbi:DNA polymerase LigD, polymerase domain [Syntrophomonas zehnderi OL-4]|uniref:DNA polymerase LigD, polymerase domain n=1 Tax=Syntrophomonas zehnderi OL-4 TaxID=690567 RepID=A0A0E4GFG2_9FIRM|nr:non-homologous end-joining DNA ligase [Syntrophomonas zehnderi]CFY09215.1 DNA polymerase LigD, polymerase domain [Syntrophomonas zehnderi OL-4]
MSKSSQILLEGRRLKLSNLDKVLWPGEGYTKGELIHYYAEISSYILPHLNQRPLVFTRYPDGINQKFFYQKNVPGYLPDWIQTFAWESGDKIINFMLAREKADLVWLGNQACIEVHPWLSCQASIQNPDYMVFDLDPSPDNSYPEIVVIALLIKQVLDELQLRAYIKTSGSAGLHIYVPLLPRYSYEEVRQTAGLIAGMVSTVRPDIATIERTVNKRGSKIYIDYMQNAIGQTICSPYSVRPREGAPISAPIRWEEIEEVSPDMFTIKNIFPRLSKQGDLFKSVLTDKQDLTKAMSYSN